MTRLNISFHAYVPTLHPSVLMTLLSVLSVLRLFGISVTLATPSITDLDPSHVLTSLSPMLSDEAKRALNIAALGPNHLVANLAPALSEDAKAALTNADINPAAAIASLAPALTDDAARVLNQANIDPAKAIANVAPAKLSADLGKVVGDALTDYPAPNTILGLASPFHAADKTLVANSPPGPIEDEALNALTHAMTERLGSNALPEKDSAEQMAGLQPGAAVTTMHNDISAQVSKGSLSKEGALAAHAALYNLVTPKIPSW